MKKTFIFSIAILVCFHSISQTALPWNGKAAAVVLTYDDALNVHVNNVVPALDSLGLKATFYISDYFGGLKNQLTQWKKASAKGHELGNHTIFHPCLGNLPGRGFVQRDYDMNNYSIRRMTDEIRAMNTLLTAIDGKTKRTFAYTCGDMKIRDTSFIDSLRNEFLAARSVWGGMDPIGKTDLYAVKCYPVNGETGGQLIEQVKQALAKKTFLVFLFHGVGGEHSLNVSLTAHSELLHFLKENEKSLWIAPMVELAEYIKNYQAGK